MSYCRFRNTLSDLQDCKEALENLLSGEEGPLSREELQAAKKLIGECFDVVQIVADHACLDLEDGGDLDRLEDEANKCLDAANEAAHEEETEED